MNSLRPLLKSCSGRNLLAIFPHPDDESFLAAGLFQIAKEYKIRTHVVCLTKGGRGKNALGEGNIKVVRTKELKKAVGVLNIDELVLKDFPDAGLCDNQEAWVRFIHREIARIKPAIILTFDPSGMTGHPDHIITCQRVLGILKARRKDTILLWRLPNALERRFFSYNTLFDLTPKPTYHLRLGFFETVTKLKAIYIHKCQMPGMMFRLIVLFEMLIEQKELYYKVPRLSSVDFRFIDFRID